jgi:POT family proton-dependent oligopeptide transporter
MAIGHLLMAIESQFLPALFFLIIGNGFFKPNITTQVGYLYDEGDPRRDGAFTIFYMGINLGAFFSPFICGTLGQVYGWHYGFGAAGIGMLAGLAVYHFGRGHLPMDRITREKVLHEDHSKEKLSKEETQGIIALVLLCALNIMYWAVYEQQGNTMQLWSENRTDWNFFGINFPSTWYQAFNPFMIFIFSPLLVKFWSWQNAKGKEPNSIIKMGMGCIITGLGFVFMIVASKLLGPTEKGSLLWLTGATALLTLGEIYLSPIGLSFVTKVAPARMVSMMMGMWLMSSFFGNYASGVIGSYFDKMSNDGVFMLVTCIGVGTGLVFLALSGVFKKALHKHL